MGVRAHHIADAYHAVGRVDHYMVLVVLPADCTFDELSDAKGILIDRQNAGPQKGRGYLALERALDLLEADIARL